MGAFGSVFDPRQAIIKHHNHMKNTLRSFTMLFVLCLTANTIFAQENDNDLARVNRVNETPVYIYSEPLNEYGVVATKGTGGKAGSFLTGGVVNEGISAKASQYLKRLNKEAKKKKFEFDAVLYSNGKQAAAIKWNDNYDTKNKDLARVKSINGVLVFALCEPVNDYEVVIEKSGGAKVGSYLSGGLANKGIEGDLTQFVRRIQKGADEEGKTIDAIIYNAGKRAIGIKFK